MNLVDSFFYSSIEESFSQQDIDESRYLKDFLREFYKTSENKVCCYEEDYKTEKIFLSSDRCRVLKETKRFQALDTRCESLSEKWEDERLRTAILIVWISRERYDLIKFPKRRLLLQARFAVFCWLYLEIFLYEREVEECSEELRIFFEKDNYLKTIVDDIALKIDEIRIVLLLRTFYNSKNFMQTKRNAILREIIRIKSEAIGIFCERVEKFTLFAAQTPKERSITLIKEVSSLIKKDSFLVRKKNFIGIVMCLVETKDLYNLVTVLSQNMDLVVKIFNEMRGCKIAREMFKLLTTGKKKDACWVLGDFLKKKSSMQIVKVLRENSQFAEYYFYGHETDKEVLCIICLERFKNRDVVFQCQDCVDSKTHLECFKKSGRKSCLICRKIGICKKM